MLLVGARCPECDERWGTEGSFYHKAGMATLRFGHVVCEQCARVGMWHYHWDGGKPLLLALEPLPAEVTT